ncbi:hypothetical protein ACA910_009377 [Epithemia clementina (nom. ined.)]
MKPTTSTPSNQSSIHSSNSPKKSPPPMVPDEFVCPITQEIMVDPVLSRYGQSYERKAIIEWLASGTHACPLTRQPLSLQNLVTHHRLRMRIEAWCETHGEALSPSSKRKNGKLTFRSDSDSDYGDYGDDDDIQNHRAICAAFLDLPQMRVRRATGDASGGGGSGTDRLSDDEEDLMEIRVRRISLAGDVPSRSAGDSPDVADGQGPSSQRRSLWSRLSRRG